MGRTPSRCHAALWRAACRWSVWAGTAAEVNGERRKGAPPSPLASVGRSRDLSFRFQRRQPRLGVGDKLSQPDLGARVLRKPKNCPHPKDAVAEPRYLVFDFFGHVWSVALSRQSPGSGVRLPGPGLYGVGPGKEV